MKNLKKVALIVSLLFLIPSAAFAGWHTRFVNNTNRLIPVSVYGEHLFWQQEDGRANVAANSSADIEMPGGICPTYFKMTTTKTHDQKYGAGSVAIGAACWNQEIVISYIEQQQKFIITYQTY